MKKIIILLSALLLSAFVCGAQNEVALKTNLVHDATLSPNLALELAIAPKWTLDLSASFNKWRSYGMIYKHAIAQPEFRYWTCDRFRGFFVGVHGIGGRLKIGDFYNVNATFPKAPNLKEHSLDNAFVVGDGIACGYDIVLCRHWNLEFELGAGYAYVRGSEYDGDVLIGNDAVFEYLGPTKLAINIVYLF